LARRRAPGVERRSFEGSNYPARSSGSRAATAHKTMPFNSCCCCLNLRAAHSLQQLQCAGSPPQSIGGLSLPSPSSSSTRFAPVSMRHWHGHSSNFSNHRSASLCSPLSPFSPVCSSAAPSHTNDLQSPSHSHTYATVATTTATTTMTRTHARTPARQTKTSLRSLTHKSRVPPQHCSIHPSGATISSLRLSTYQ
jgi:hypothetical protein